MTPLGRDRVRIPQARDGLKPDGGPLQEGHWREQVGFVAARHGEEASADQAHVVVLRQPRDDRDRAAGGVARRRSACGPQGSQVRHQIRRANNNHALRVAGGAARELQEGHLVARAVGRRQRGGRSGHLSTSRSTRLATAWASPRCLRRGLWSSATSSGCTWPSRGRASAYTRPRCGPPWQARPRAGAWPRPAASPTLGSPAGSTVQR